MKIAVIGASGLIGNYMMQVGADRGHAMLGTQRTGTETGLVRLDANDHPALESWLRDVGPEAIIYTAAFCWVDGCENAPADAMRENATNPAFAAGIAADLRARFVYISTSYVFDGKKESYGEEDSPNPINVYGESKLRGEEMVMQAMRGEALILRTMGVYGREKRGKNFYYQIARAGAENRKVNVPEDQFGNVTYAGDFASACLLLVERKRTGIWNVAGPDPHVRRSDFARWICPDVVVPVTSDVLGQTARRPVHGGLDITKLEQEAPGLMRAFVKIDL